MLEILLSMSKDRPGLFIIIVGILFVIVAWVVIITLYIYINIYLKEICKIVYKEALLHKPICKGFFSDIIFK
ncbi:hypothetical protein [Acinetobacter sp. WC-323]|uniref:hypothetical protein n=1 Tax=Acinetobacter sp. WC-323 TaxID=903918 RepID=UPI000519BA4F|nr:hypothetical protein [Acinetobacter sp. WC-323]